MNEHEKRILHGTLPGLLVGTVSAAALLSLAVEARGQEGTLATLGLSFGGSYTANDPGDDDSDLTTVLSFDLSSVTSTQSFGLSADGRFVLDEEGFEFERPGVDLAYGLSNRSTAFDLGLSYRIRDVDGALEVVDPLTLTVIDLIEDDGTLESLRLEAGLETGRDAPFGTDTTFSYTERSYADTNDPDLNDLESWQIGTTLRFDVDPRIALRSTASYRETQEDDATQTRTTTTRFGVGGDFLIDPLWSASLDIGYSRFETEEEVLGTRLSSEEDGLGFSASVIRRFRDGSLGVAVARDVSDIGAEDSVRIFRDRDLRNGGALAWSLGFVSFPNGDTAPLVSASYAQPTQRGSFAVGLQQSTSVDSEDRSVINTNIDISYEQAVNANSGWSVNGSLISVERVGTESDQARAEVGLAYNHALTRDWDLSTALRHRISYEDGARDSSATTLSLSIGRNFSFRP